VGSRRSALQVALETIRSAAAIIDASGDLLEANAVAKELFANGNGRSAWNEALRAIRAPGEHADWIVVPVESTSANEAYFVMSRRQPGDEFAPKLKTASKRWDLTKRQCEVLELIAEGRPNAAIAAILGISARTVEIHVTALLQKAGVENRAALIVRLLTLR
jgi:DNA-binding NarL/FixJ family response regulator